MIHGINQNSGIASERQATKTGDIHVYINILV